MCSCLVVASLSRLDAHCLYMCSFIVAKASEQVGRLAPALWHLNYRVANRRHEI